MNRNLLEAAYRIETAPELDSVWSIFVGALLKHDIDNAIYITASDSPPLDTRVFSTLPQSWPKDVANSPDYFDPFLAHLCATFEMSKIGPEFISDHDYVGEETRNYVEQASKYGWRAGLAIPCRLRGTGRHGGFVIGNGYTRFVFDRKIMSLADNLRSFCLITHRKIESLQNPGTMTTKVRPLSVRERETLGLLAKGIKPKQIAHTLSLSESSVRLYLKNARTKLGADTKEEAVAIFIEQQNITAKRQK